MSRLGSMTMRAALATLAVLVVVGWMTPVAMAATPRPVWKIDAVANTTVAPGTATTMFVEVRNVGDAALDSSVAPIRMIGTLPAGLSLLSVSSDWDCSNVTPPTFTCVFTGQIPPIDPGNSALDSIKAFEIQLDVGSTTGVLTSEFEVKGGGATAAVGAAPMTVTSAEPEFGIAAFDASVTDAAGTPFSQAGGHPFAASTSIDFNTYRDPIFFRGSLRPVEGVKDVTVDLPPGFFGDPSGVAQCTLAQLSVAINITVMQQCAASSQVGVLYVRQNGFQLSTGPIPVFNMVPPPNAPARLGFNFLGAVVTLDVTVRTGSDYGLTAHLRNVSEGLALAGSTLTLWGVPADPVHNRDRACPGRPPAAAGNGPLCPSSAPLKAFLRNPTSCPDPGVGLPTTLSIDSWVDPGDVKQMTIFSHRPLGYPFPQDRWGEQLGTTGCAAVPFDPTFEATPALTAAGRPTGYTFDLTLPQTDDPEAIGQSDLRKTVVTMPLGVHFSTSATAGLTACSPAQIQLHNDAEPSCPEASTLGTVTITTPALPDPLIGSIYLASQNDNPFNTLIAIYVVARGSGVLIKQAGKVELDLFTGQVTTTVDDTPQAPFSSLHLEFKDGDRAPLVNPTACGTYTTHAQLTSWSGKVVELDSPFTVTKDGHGQPCPGRKFSPGFTAGTESNIAGTSSPFHVRLTRDDDDEDIAGLRLHVPGGLLGRIADVSQLCGNADASAGRCPESSRIASVTAGAGAGPTPFYITDGRAYLTGPYKGAPFGLSIVVPAKAGPFDLGSVIVRAAIQVDKHTAEIDILSDPLPILLQGVTLGVRDIRVATDRPGFWLNPTNCAEKRITATITSASGQSVQIPDRFQAVECRGLPVRPRMRLEVGSVGHTARNATSPLTTTLTIPRGNANLRSVALSLPTTINARLPVINRACTRAQFEAHNCDGARAGSATAITPVLKDPLRGNVYFVKNGHPLPDLFIALRGQVDFDLIGRTSIPNGKRLATTFDAVPDVPVTSFKLQLVSGRQGPVGAATNLCSRRGRTARAQLDYVGQNGRARHVEQRLIIRGCGGGRHHTRHRHRNRR
jgi:hypothetical protein